MSLADQCLGEDLPMSEAPLPPAPLQPMRSQERGVRLRRKPMRALHEESTPMNASDLEFAEFRLTVALGYQTFFATHQRPWSQGRGRASRRAQGRWRCFRLYGYGSEQHHPPCCYLNAGGQRCYSCHWRNPSPLARPFGCLRTAEVVCHRSLSSSLLMRKPCGSNH